MAKKYKTEYEKLMHGKNIARHERAFAAATTGKPRRSVFVPLPQPWVWHPGSMRWSGTTVVPFDNYSHLDCDATGSYLMLDTKPLHKNRFYDLSLKTTLGSEVYFSRPFRFKVV